MKLGCQVAAHLAPITIIVIVKFVAAFATITTAGTLPRPRQVYATQQSLSFFLLGVGGGCRTPTTFCFLSAFGLVVLTPPQIHNGFGRSYGWGGQ